MRIIAFLLAVFPLIATPGASLTLLARRVVADGPRAGAAVIAGTATGLYVHALAAAAGLSALVMRSSVAFEAVRVLGAVYLVGLGVFTLATGGRRRAPEPAGRAAAGSSGRASGAQPSTTNNLDRSTYTQAVLGNVLNPKAASIFLTLAPQFIDPHRTIAPQLLLLATSQAILVALWLGSWTAIISRTRRALRTDRFVGAVSRWSGGVLVLVGIRTAVA
jgi:threonine/homoserine/homoserine lactone efflux protein